MGWKADCFDGLRQALDHINDGYEYASVAGTPDPRTLARAFNAHFDRSQQDTFCTRFARGAKLDPEAVTQAQLHVPQPKAIARMVQVSEQSALAEYPSAAFCQALTKAWGVCEPSDDRQVLQQALEDAEDLLQRQDHQGAFDAFLRLSQAMDRDAAPDDASLKTLRARLLPQAIAAANPFVGTDDLAARQSSRWQTELYTLARATSSAAAGEGGADVPHPVALDASGWAAQFVYSYRTLRLCYERDSKDDIHAPHLIRCHKLMAALSAFLLQGADCAALRPICQAWQARHGETHEFLREDINWLVGLLGLPKMAALSAIPDFNPAQSAANVLSPALLDEVTMQAYLAVPGMRNLRTRLQIATRCIAEGAHPGDIAALKHRAFCLQSEPGTGKTEAIRRILASFAAESTSAEALALGWHGPVHAIALDSEALCGTHFNESADKIRQALSGARADAAARKGVAVVFVDEVDRFLMGTGNGSIHEDFKNLTEFTRSFDNSIPGNTQFLVSATNHFEDLAPAAKSRIGADLIHWQTPAAVRFEAIKQVADSWGLNWETADDGNKVPSLAMLSSLVETLTLRDIYALINDAAVPPKRISKMEHLVAGLYDRLRALVAAQDRPASASSVFDFAGELPHRQELWAALLHDEVPARLAFSRHLHGSTILHLKTFFAPSYARSLWLNQQGVMVLTSDPISGQETPHTLSARTLYARPDTAIEALFDPSNLDKNAPATRTCQTSPEHTLFQNSYSDWGLNIHPPKPKGKEQALWYTFRSAKDEAQKSETPQTLADLFAAHP